MLGFPYHLIGRMNHSKELTTARCSSFISPFIFTSLLTMALLLSVLISLRYSNTRVRFSCIVGSLRRSATVLPIRSMSTAKRDPSCYLTTPAGSSRVYCMMFSTKRLERVGDIHLIIYRVETSFSIVPFPTV